MGHFKTKFRGGQSRGSDEFMKDHRCSRHHMIHRQSKIAHGHPRVGGRVWVLKVPGANISSIHYW
jgi:hypothetical protein